MSEQPVGREVEWSGAPRPPLEPLGGRYVELLPLDAERDAEALYEASHPPHGDPSVWTYLREEPFDSVAAFREHLRSEAEDPTAIPFAILPARSGRPEGKASYLRIDPANGSIEVGNIWLGPGLKRTAAATEAIYLLARNAFETLGYRRFEWKRNDLNEPSGRAADRFGFAYEGTFRNHLVTKGRNRDTAWHAITAEEWPERAAAFKAWLAPGNFDESGNQRRRLGELMPPRDPSRLSPPPASRPGA